MAIYLTGRYQDTSGRDYVVMQDDLQRTDRNASIAFLRVMRQQDEQIGSGTIHVSDDAFAAAGSDDDARNSAIGGALIVWIAGTPAIQRYFQLRAIAANDSSAAITMRSAPRMSMEPTRPAGTRQATGRTGQKNWA